MAVSRAVDFVHIVQLRKAIGSKKSTPDVERGRQYNELMIQLNFTFHKNWTTVIRIYIPDILRLFKVVSVELNLVIFL